MYPVIVASDPSNLTKVLAARGCRLGRIIHSVVETTSTNDDAKAGAGAGAPHGAVWIAGAQSGGRGRQGRTWVSPPGENLLFSVLLRTSCAPGRVPSLSLVCGIAVRDAVANALGESGERALVKWPNDVVIQDPSARAGFRKVAGILVESALTGSKVEHIIVGVGVNVHTRNFPGELEATATSIARESAKVPDRAAILTDILVALDREIDHASSMGLERIHGRLSAHDALNGRAIASEDGSIRGIASGIELDGRLLVRSADGVVTKVASGEMRVHSL